MRPTACLLMVLLNACASVEPPVPRIPVAANVEGRLAWMFGHESALWSLNPPRSAPATPEVRDEPQPQQETETEEVDAGTSAAPADASLAN
jgi:hypothetical protein